MKKGGVWGFVLNYTFFSYFIGLPNRNSLIDIEIHMRAPKATKKIWQYKHQLGGCRNDSTLEQLCKIFLKDLHEYTTYDDNQLKLPERDEFNDTTSLISQILKYQQFKNSTINVVNLRIWDLLSKFVSQSIQTSRKLIASVKDQVNIIILEEYRKILRNCGCGICSVGIEVEPDRFGRLSANNYCCKVNDRIAELSTKYSSFSSY